MKIKLEGSPEVIISNPHSHHAYFAWPTVAKLQNGRLAVVASGFRLRHVCPFGKTVIAFSEDEGKTYTLPAPVIDTPLDDRDGGITPFGKSSVVVTSFNNMRAFQKMRNETAADRDYVYSYLDTVTDEEEEKYLGTLFRISHDCGVTFGEIHKSPVTSPHGPLELKNGKLVWVGRTFSPTNVYMENDCIAAYEMSADGTMTYLGSVENIYDQGERLMLCEPDTFELEDGTLLCHIRAQRPKTSKLPRVFTTYQSISRDGGRTWSTPVHLLSDMRGGAPAHIMRHSSGVLISVYGYRQAPFGVKVMFSHDDGQSWSTGHDLYINNQSSDLGYPSTVELSDGSLLTVFYARERAEGPAVIMQQKWRIEE